MRDSALYSVAGSPVRGFRLFSLGLVAYQPRSTPAKMHARTRFCDRPATRLASARFRKSL
jgi:hypothetical protein